MAHWVYILQSESNGRYYCGRTTDLAMRVHQHNDPANNLAKTTKRFGGPWALVCSQLVESGSEAALLERRIKKRGIGRFLTELKGGGSSRLSTLNRASHFRNRSIGSRVSQFETEGGFTESLYRTGNARRQNRWGALSKN